MTTMTTAERCRAQARSMEEEGWYVCANVLRQAAVELDAKDAELAQIEVRAARKRDAAHILASVMFYGDSE